jgi:hypothetical protein
MFRKNIWPAFSGSASCLLMLVSCLAYSLTLKMGLHTPPKLRLSINGVNSFISQKIEFIVTAVVSLRFQQFYVTAYSPEQL